MDMEKAFDRVNRSFLRAVLETQGLGPYILTSIFAFYSTPLCPGQGECTLLLPITDQEWHETGVPLSPLLFALTLEPLLCKIRANLDIKGLTVGNMEHKLSAYADNILFHLTEPLISLPKPHEGTSSVWGTLQFQN